MRSHRIIPLFSILAAFTAYSVWVMLTHEGYLGFVWLALREPWGMQMIIDVGLSVGLFSIWMHHDAKERGITAWPYLIVCLLLGSIGALAYLLHCELRQAPALGSVAGSAGSSP